MVIKNIEKLAPIGICTYSRINHLKQTVKALQKNILAKESTLYIFLDAPKKGDEQKVSIVRKFVYSINGFKKIHVIERKENNIIANIHGGIKKLLNEYGKMIFMEDDIVTAPYFLKFMNDGLNFFKNNKKIVAISGYNVPVKYPKSYKHSYYLSKYFNAWGFATWTDRGLSDMLDNNNAYNEIMQDKCLHKKIMKIHPKLINGLKKIQKGTLDAGDYKIVFHSIKNDLSTVKPLVSFVNNIGHDGSGLHCGVSNKFGKDILNNGVVKFNHFIKYNPKIDKIYYKYFKPTPNILKRILKKIINYK